LKNTSHLGALMDEPTTYGVFVSGVAGSVDEFRDGLVAQGMSEERAEQVAMSMPCFVKRDVPLAVAEQYKQAFEQAGAWVVLENWQTTQNPAACTGYVDRDDDEPALEFAVAVGTPLRSVEAAEAIDVPPPPGPDEEFEVARERETSRPTRFPPTVPPPMSPASPSRSKRPSMPPREHPMMRWLPGAIIAALILIPGSYMYGCTRVMQKQRDFNEQLGELGRVLENRNAKGRIVSEAIIVREVQQLASGAGVDVDRDEVTVMAEPIEVVRDPFSGGCRVGAWPEAMQYLSAQSQARLVRESQSCGVPRWIISVRVDTSVRWGLASEDLRFEKHVPVIRYSEIDDDDG
jgi:hypothetical protein